LPPVLCPLAGHPAVSASSTPTPHRPRSVLAPPHPYLRFSRQRRPPPRSAARALRRHQRYRALPAALTCAYFARALPVSCSPARGGAGGALCPCPEDAVAVPACALLCSVPSPLVQPSRAFARTAAPFLPSPAPVPRPHMPAPVCFGQRLWRVAVRSDWP